MSYDPKKQGSVTMFTDKDCMYKSGRFDAGDTDTIVQKYSLSDFYRNDLKNDSPSSVMVPEGYTLRLWQSSSFGDKTVDIEGEYTDDRQALKCHNLHDDHFDNMASSIEVIRTK